MLFKITNPNKVYILGGLTDKNIQKVTFQKAWEHSAKTNHLPTQDRHWNGKNYIQRYWPSIKYLISSPLTLRFKTGLKHFRKVFLQEKATYGLWNSVE